jgi:Protein of unknown function (DUF3592)
VVGVLLLVIGILSFVAMGKVWRRSNEVWTEAQGVVDEPYLYEGERLDGIHRKRHSRLQYSTSDKTWNAKIKYHYSVLDNSYTGDEVLPEEPSNDEDVKEVRKILDKFPAGAAVAVYYNPKSPDRSRLTAKEPPREFYLDIMFATLFSLFGISLLALAVNARKTPSAGTEVS